MLAVRMLARPIGVSFTARHSQSNISIAACQDARAFDFAPYYARTSADAHRSTNPGGDPMHRMPTSLPRRPSPLQSRSGSASRSRRASSGRTWSRCGPSRTSPARPARCQLRMTKTFALQLSRCSAWVLPALLLLALARQAPDLSVCPWRAGGSRQEAHDLPAAAGGGVPALCWSRPGRRRQKVRIGAHTQVHALNGI